MFKQASVVSGIFLGLFTLSTGPVRAEENIQEPIVQNTYTSYPDACSPCGETLSCDQRRPSVEFDFSGWAESGIYVNSHGSESNGPMHIPGNARTDFLLDQLYLIGDLKVNTKSGLKLGARADFVYGVDALGMQSRADDEFDSGWGNNRHGYGAAMYQLYGTVGYKDLNVKIGKFMTTLGWEGTASRNNFFYSHSYCYYVESTTHSGVLADYDVTDRLNVNLGWTTGMNTSFRNRYDDYAVMAGFTYKLSDKAKLVYQMVQGEMNNEQRFGDWRFGNDSLSRRDYFIQSLCLEWKPTKRFTYVMQYNLRNDDNVAAGTYDRIGRYSSYGVNNHFLYKANNCWATGLRLEWFRDNGGGGYITPEKANYFQMTLGLNWTPIENLSIRPEVRYDTVMDGTAKPFGNNRSDQISGGFGMLYAF